uniref:DUF1618 domain-containing protein n=1 Tax=Oryza glumipatula TaxID=40148 RepID=A0A0E0B0J3_9ORYZ
MEAHGWMILDRIVHCWSDDGDGVVGGDDDPTASEVAYTCSGHPIRVSLRVADPPAVSRLYVHRGPGWPRVYDMGDAEAIAAHRGSILLSARVPFADLGTVTPGQFPVDYFVYTAGEGLRRPSLTRLPPCFIGGFSSPEQRVMVEQNVGFFCHGGDNNAAGDFTVADINMHKGGRAVELCVLNHYHHAPDCPQQQPQWKVDILEMQQQPNQNENHHLRGWWTDAVLPLHDSYLACVDCYHGIILIDVKNQLYFNYIPLPVEAMNGRRVDKYSPDPARSASINSAGNITVVCIADDNAAAGGRNNNSSAGSAFIESWSLVDIHKSRWVLDFTMEAGKFWDICSAANQPLLPHAPPAFPLVSMANPFAISFLLYDKANNFLLEDKGNGLYWMIEVDMRNQALLSPATLYISEEEEELFINGKEEEQERCCDERYPPMKYFHGHNFIPSWLPSYLKGGDTTSWELSKMKGKQQMAMESSGMDAHLSRPLAGLKIA